MRAALLFAVTLLTACAPTTASPKSAALPPVHGTFDYQLGGSYDIAGLAVVVRDESETPLPGAYDICYVNGFQTQPDAAADWRAHHASALLHDAAGALVVDPDWPDEYVLDPSTPTQRTAILDVIGPLITGCAARGFDAVDLDNFDTFTRFAQPATGRIDQAGALDLARSYVSLAHAKGLAIGQKNAAESAETGHRDVGFDFAIAEECAAYHECADYSNVYGQNVLQIEYTDNLPQPFTGVCDAPGRAPQTILRDRKLVAAGVDGYVREQCG